MSEQKFQQAKGNLAFSQGLVDHIQGQQSPQQAPPDMAQQPVAQQPIESPQQEQQDIAQTVKDTMEPYLKKIEEIVASKKPQDVSLQIDGQMMPKQ